MPVLTNVTKPLQLRNAILVHGVTKSACQRVLVLDSTGLMKKLLLCLFVVVLYAASAFAQKRANAAPSKGGVAVAFVDEVRADPESIENLQYFLKPIAEIVKRDFPGVELKILKRGELLHLPDGTGLNVEIFPPAIGYVLAARGRKRRILTGAQSDADFACAAAAFFRRPSAACPK